MAELTLRPPREEDAALWHRWQQERRSRAMNPLKPATVEELVARLRATRSDLATPAAEYRWMVSSGGETIGTVSAFHVSWPMRFAEIGYMLGEAYHGKGLGKQAVRLLVDKLFSESKLYRIQATVHVGNEPSIRLLRRLGFRQEGVLREHFLIQGERVDEAVFGLLRPEWTPTAEA